MGRATEHEVDEWRWSIVDNTLRIHGKVTCPNGEITVDAYSVTPRFLWWSKKEYIGSRSNTFSKSRFYIEIDGVDDDIDDLSIECNIEPVDD